jgi:hypothetical protein
LTLRALRILFKRIVFLSAMDVPALKSLLREKFPEAAGFQNSGVRLKTAPEQGGPLLLPGGLVELVAAHPRAGASRELLRLLLSRPGMNCALVDGGDAFDPCGAPRELLERLLWARCRRVDEAVKAADLLLRDGNLPVVAVDLRLNRLEELRRLPGSVWHRLRLLAARGGTAVVVITPARLVAGAARRWVLDGARAEEDCNAAAA